MIGFITKYFCKICNEFLVITLLHQYLHFNMMNVGIIGSGQMGIGISRLIAPKCNVFLYNRSIQNIKSRIIGNLPFHITPVSSLEKLAEMQLIIEVSEIANFRL